MEEEEEEEEEGLFKADAVNEEDPERDRATPACVSVDHRTTARRETHPYLSMLLYQEEEVLFMWHLWYLANVGCVSDWPR